MLSISTMRRMDWRWRAAAPIACALWLACGKSSEDKQPSASDVSKELGDVAEAAEGYAWAKREAFTSWAAQQVDSLDDAINQLEKKAAKMEGKARTEANDSVAKLKQQRDELRGKVAQMDRSAEKAWLRARSEIADGFRSMAELYEAAARRIE